MITSFDGYFYFLLGDNIFWINIIQNITLTLTNISILWFASNFLELKKYSLKSYYTCIFSIVASTFNLFFVTFFLNISVYFIKFISLFNILLLTYIIIFCFIKGSKTAKFFIVAWISYCLGTFLSALHNFDVLEKSFIVTHGIKIGTILESLLLSFALANKYHLLRLEKENAQKMLTKIQIQTTKILEQKVLERTQELAQQNQELQMLQQNRDLMVSAVSHDLRNPLNPILNYSSPHYAQKNASEVLPIIHERAKAMQALIGDIMDIYKAEKLTINAQPASLYQASKQAIEVISEAQPKMPLIINEIPENLLAIFEYKYIERVLENLLSNAIKYTKPKEQGGEVRLFVETPNPSPFEGEGSKPLFVRIGIQDNGMGIPQDKFEEIFLPFSNPNAKNIGSAKSVGIGLTFCKTIVEAHGSRIEVESEVGKGSTFSFVLPIMVGKEENLSENIEIVLTKEERTLLLPTIEELKKYPMKNARVRQILQKMDTHNSPALVAWQTAMLQAREKNDSEAFEERLHILN
jgi:signal transduction histidine kinase